MCFPPGAIYTQPFSIISPSAPSLTLISLISLSLAARDAVNPAGICCTRTIPASRFLGSIGITCCNDFGPPVEHARATIFLLPLLILRNLDGLTFCGTVSFCSFLFLRAETAAPDACLSVPEKEVLPITVDPLGSLLPKEPVVEGLDIPPVLSNDALVLVATLSILYMRCLKLSPFVSK